VNKAESGSRGSTIKPQVRTAKLLSDLLAKILSVRMASISSVPAFRSSRRDLYRSLLPVAGASFCVAIVFVIDQWFLQFSHQSLTVSSHSKLSLARAMNHQLLEVKIAWNPRKWTGRNDWREVRSYLGNVRCRIYLEFILKKRRDSHDSLPRLRRNRTSVAGVAHIRKLESLKDSSGITATSQEFWNECFSGSSCPCHLGWTSMHLESAKHCITALCKREKKFHKCAIID